MMSKSKSKSKNKKDEGVKLMAKNKDETMSKNMESMMEDMLNDRIWDTANPEWKPIVFEGKELDYMISNVGEVYSNALGRLVKKSLSDQGYERVSLRTETKYGTFRVHRLVGQAFIPNPENKPEINHIDGVKTNNWYRNLEWATSAENKQHAMEMGCYDNASFTRVGTDRPNAVYTDEQAHAICKLLEGGHNCKRAAEKVGVSIGLARSIKYAGKWKHISSQYDIPAAGEMPREKGFLRTSSTYSHEQIHAVCKLLEEGKGLAEISRLLSVPVSLPHSIKQRMSWMSISRDYEIPEPESKTRPDNLRGRVIELLDSGLSEPGEIVTLLDLPDNRVNRKYIALVKFQLKKERSTTIDQLPIAA